MNEDRQILNAIEALTQAAEARILAETSRSNFEQQRLFAEQERLRMERENNAVLCKILRDTGTIVQSVSTYSPDDHDKMLQILESLLALTQVIALRVNGTELVSLVETIRAIQKGASVQVTLNDQANVGNIVEGTQTISQVYDLDAALTAASKAIGEDNPEAVENALSTLPEDVIDVAVAALSGPIAAARMIARKVSGKWRVNHV